MMPDMMPRVKRSSLALEAAQILREHLLQGRFAPGTRLVEGDIAAQLGISRGTVREVMRILEGEGLVEVLPGHGIRVAHLSVQDITEVYSLRSLLEQEVVRRLARAATPSDLAELDQAIETLFKVARSGSPATVVDHDQAFHQLLWKLAGHRRLAQVLEGLLSQMRVYLAINTRAYADLRSGVEDHRAIVDAIRSGSGELAAARMAEHLQQASEVVVNYLRESQAG